MSVSDARKRLENTMQFGAPELRAFAAAVLADMDATSANAEKCRRFRHGPKGVADRVATPTATPPRHGPKGVADRVATPTATPPRPCHDTVATVSVGVVGGRGALVLDLPLGSGSPALSESSLGKTNQDPPPQSGVSLVPSVKPKKAGTKAPSSVDPSASAWCAGYGIPEPTPGSESANFLDYWSQRTRDATSLDWAARWRSRPDWTKKQAMNGHRKPGRLVQPPAAPGQKTWKMGEYA
jgi:hypothetical protein